MTIPLVRRPHLILVAVIALAGCRQSEPPRGPAPAAQSLDQIRFGPPAIPGVDGPLAQTQPDMPGEPWTLGPPIVVTTAELMARGSGSARDRSSAPRLVKIRPDRTLLPDNPLSRPLAQWPPSPFFRSGGPAAAFVAGTPNVDVAFLADTGFALPPDTMGDAGPTQYVVALNGRVRAITKATGAIDPVFDLDSDVFYGAAANGQSTGDPRVRYDRRAGRWYILMFNIAVPNRYLLAVSSSSIITGATTWTINFWNNTRTQGGVGGAAGCLGDYPTLGVDEDALYIGVNQFCGSALNTVTFDSTSVYVLNRANLLAGAGTVVAFDGVLPNSASAGPYTPQGVDNFDNGTNEGYVIGVDNASFSTLMLRRVNNPGGTPSLSANVSLTVPSTSFPLDVPQPGAQPLDGIDDRLMNAVIRDGQLWTVHQIGVNASGVAVSSGSRAAERWYQIGNLSGTPSVTQSGTVFDNAASNPVHHWMGSIMVNGQGHAALGASRSGTTTFVNTEFTGRLAGAALGTMETPTQYSSNASTIYNIQTTTTQRWGDYSYTSVDPNDDMTMWTIQEYPTASNNYAVRLIRLLAPPPAAIASLSPNSVATGQTGVNVTVTGTSSAGSGFFDPGAGFPSRIAAAFSGSGVTVTGISFNSPTSLTLTLDTTGAATGARTLTVTNPDGQQSALASALTITGGVTPPVAVNDSYNTPFNTALNVAAPGVLGNDNANGGGTMTATLNTGPASGTLALNANGSFSYTPASGFTGNATFTYRANTAAGGQSAPATVTITVNPPPAPTAANDSYNTPFNTALNVAAPGVLANDNANGGGTLTATLNTGPASGTLALNANGSFSYTPANGFTGNATFTYRANTNAGGQSNLATVTVTVGGPPPGFSSHPADLRTFVGQAAQFTVGLTGSPTPTCQWQMSADLGGTWSNLSNSPPYSGVTTSFLTIASTSLAMSGMQYRCLASNGSASAASNAGTLSVAIMSAGGAPGSGGWNGSFIGRSGSSIAFNVNAGLEVIGLTYNTLITCGGTFNYGPTIVGEPIYGDRFRVDAFPSCPASASLAGNFTSATTAGGLLTYTTTTPFCACAGTFQEQWTASSGPTAPAAPQILVQPTSQSPAAGQPARFTMAASGRPFATIQWEMSTNGGGSWANVPGATPYSGATTPTLTILGSGVPGLQGAQFRARATNATGSDTTLAVILNPTGAPPPPTGVNDSFSTPFQTALNVSAPGVLGNDNSNGGGAMTAVLGSTTPSGVLSLNANGGFTYTPNPGFTGTDTFTYQASNASGPGNLATVSIAVGPAPTGPVPPSNFRILAMTGNTITFAWNLPTAGATPTALQLEGGLTPGSLLGQLPLGVTPSATLALPTGSFYLRLRSIAGGAVSDPSNEILAHINVPVPPSAPAGLLGLVNGAALDLAWTPTFGGGEPMAAILEVTGTVNASLALGATETFSFNGVPAGSYTFSVRQTNGGGASAPSAPVTLTFPGACSGAPQAPADFVAFKSGGLLTMFWSPPAAGAAPTGYQLNVSGSFVGSLLVAGRSLVVAPPPGTYTLAVVATNPCGFGPATSPQTLSFP
jgi:Bacterial Ig domain